MLNSLPLDEFLARLKSIINLAKRYSVRTGLRVSLHELERIQGKFLKEGDRRSAKEVSEIIEFLKEESSLIDENRQRKAQKLGEIWSEVPVGMMLTFRYYGTSLTGELKGYLADRALIEVKDRYGPKIFEVDPFDIKL